MRVSKTFLGGATAIVGAHREDEGDSDAGAAYVFERQSGGVWNEVAKLRTSDHQVHDQFGASAAIDGNEMVIGV